MRHWSKKSAETLAAWLSIGFGSMLEALIPPEELTQTARRYGTSLENFQDILWGSRNLKLSTVARALRACGALAAIVVYPDRDTPVLPEMFLKCWEMLGCPQGMHDINDLPPNLATEYRELREEVTKIGVLNVRT